MPENNIVANMAQPQCKNSTNYNIIDIVCMYKFRYFDLKHTKYLCIHLRIYEFHVELPINKVKQRSQNTSSLMMNIPTQNSYRGHK